MEHFRDFPEWIRENLADLKNRPVLTCASCGVVRGTQDAAGSGVLWATFFGVGALVWRLATGEAPPPHRHAGWAAQTPGRWPAIFEALLAPHPDGRPESHEALRALLESADWSWFPARAEVAKSQEGAAEEDRYEIVRALPDGGSHVFDRLLERHVERWSLGRALSAGERDRVKVLASASLGGIQSIVRADLERGEVDLAYVPAQTVGEGMEGVPRAARCHALAR